jgi:hypothetical protein
LPSCDSSRVTIINEGTPLHSAENGLWEIFYINISEEDMVSDHPANTDDNVIPKADEEQIAITDGYLEGIVSFQVFMTKVENSDSSESGMEDSSDTDYEEEVLERNSNDPEYFPEESSNPVRKRKCTRVTKRLPPHLQGNQIFFFC